MSEREPEDRVEALLRATGRRPEVPHERAQRVRAAAEAAWSQDVRRRTWRRRLAFAATAAAAAALAAVFALTDRRGLDPAPALVPAAVVERVVGPGRPALREGDPIAENAVVATGDAGRLALRLRSGFGVRLDIQTRLRVLSGDALSIEAGAVYLDSAGPGGPAIGSIEVRTPLYTLRNLGTRFEARLSESNLVVRVRDGAVSVEGAGPPLRIDAGRQLDLRADGARVERPLEAFDGTWEWVAGVTPMMDIEGRRLSEFLAWIARERGLEVRFADPGQAASAPAIVLNGSIAGLTLDQALDSVLATSGLRGRTEGRVLVVEGR